MVCTSYYKNNDQWQEICDLHIKREGKWEKICAGWRKTDGEWQQFYLSNKPSVEFLVVAGGGGGGANNVGYDPSGGGGGAGGFRVSNGAAEVSGRNSEPEMALPLEVGVTYTVEVGGGGNGSNGDYSHGQTGNNSVLGIITSLGGGGAGYYGSSSYDGGSGGGRPGDGTRGCGTANQGHDGNVGGGQGAGGGGAGGSSLGCTGTFNRTYYNNTTITIPDGVTSVTYTIHGGAGGRGSPASTRVNTSGAFGARGQKINGTMSNVAGETLTLTMGAPGSTNWIGNQGGAGGSGYVNGGNGGNDGSTPDPGFDAGPGGGGGGATAIALGSTLLALAGGGGGGACICFVTFSGKDPAGKTSTTINSTGTASNGSVGGTSGASFNGGGGGGGGGFPGGDGGYAYVSGNDISGEGGYGGDGYYNPSYHSSASTLETSDSINPYITIEYQVGTTGPDSSSSDGGDGLPSNITGISTYYAGGGGTYSGDGGIGGGGDGGYNNYCGTSKAWSHGTTNTGGGGGGTGNICAPGRPGNSQLGNGLRQAGNGGSGIVIFRVPQLYQAKFSAGMTVNGQSSGSSFVPTPNTAVSGYNIYSVTGGIGSFTLEFA